MRERVISLKKQHKNSKTVIIITVENGGEHGRENKDQ